MSERVTIVDYGLGNIFSVARAVEHFGVDVLLSDDPCVLGEASRLILPGVGAFAIGMQGLRERALIEPLRKFAASGRPLLGICLGMQMLLSGSEEFGDHEGLGIIPGLVAPVSGQTATGAILKVPHVGWSPLHNPLFGNSWDGSILAGLPEACEAYFVHSYTAVPADDAHRLADTWYGNCRISAAVRKNNVYGCQFHPEKSGPAGLKIIENFLSVV
ncbi:MAG: imidazole glycerol phosphate synthase subunit HisH [Methyloversatilis sp.]|uniref:imidazole glycerol phosphate synthase subunit HisH n=1 Tax=Methyloversatilis sp. TaxID=2569862 RepID=UPI00273768ED|nr:imidazole glycerol phosphate synthase subunit HisH [Methyloversatilis sp.]MDP3871352.1 imidazole glycerol phosphate synthase subunit HisH [Methyloversatilis sp.]